MEKGGFERGVQTFKCVGGFVYAELLGNNYH